MRSSFQGKSGEVPGAEPDGRGRDADIGEGTAGLIRPETGDGESPCVGASFVNNAPVRNSGCRLNLKFPGQKGEKPFDSS